jgi:hypothetical protein
MGYIPHSPLCPPPPNLSNLEDPCYQVFVKNTKNKTEVESMVNVGDSARLAGVLWLSPSPHPGAVTASSDSRLLCTIRVLAA